MATYNGALYVAQQLRSIEEQSRPPDELIVVDDQSSDRTVEIIKETVARGKIRCTLHCNAERQGIPNVFETALRLCHSHDIIALCDQDDLWLPEKLATIERIFLSRPEVEVVFSNAEVVDGTLRHIRPLLALGRRTARRLREGDGLRVLISRNIATGATMAFRSRLLPGCLPLSAVWIHDGWIASLAAARKAPIYYIPDALIQYRQHGSNYVGAGGGSLLSLIRTERANKNFYYDRQLARYTALRDRLTQDADSPASSLALLDRKLAHLNARREAANAGLFRKLLLVGLELLRLRYFRLSRGFASASRELCVW